MTSEHRHRGSGTRRKIPIIDVFAGPGGLGEGFSSIRHPDGTAAFKLALSIEKDRIAHSTLALRAAFRSLRAAGVPDEYYEYVRKHIGRETLHRSTVFSEAYRHALTEAKCEALGPDTHSTTDEWIKTALKGHEDWVLIGGPPCQAYSLAGRSRLRPVDPVKFENDEKHFLYKEYLRIIENFRPAIFVMENVKGMLSATHGGKSIFERILGDLRKPSDDLEYEVHSLVQDKPTGEDKKPDFVIRSEQYGVPQARHRVILLGIRKGFSKARPDILTPHPSQITVAHAIGKLPRLRSRLSREEDSVEAWHAALDWLLSSGRRRERFSDELIIEITTAISRATANRSAGKDFHPWDYASERSGPPAESGLYDWYHDPRLGGVLQHEARGHMRSDLHRYLFSSAYAEVFGQSPNLKSFPAFLMPEHENAKQEDAPFLDRFRVQCWKRPSTTVVSHISKDGHYYIHPDPAQCRSLTVREAARLQTFPDNYFFEGNRTQQYHQVGNAVPPWLARQIGQIVLKVCEDAVIAR